jgi:hypothetical protein
LRGCIGGSERRGGDSNEAGRDGEHAATGAMNHELLLFSHIVIGLAKA